MRVINIFINLILSIALLTTQGFAHEGEGSFKVLSMTPGYWLCNAMVTVGNASVIPLPDGTVTLNQFNSLQAIISGPWANTLSPIKNNGTYINLNSSGFAHIQNSLNSLVFTLKSPLYNATYVVDLCTSDPGDQPGSMRGPRIQHFKTWVSVTDLGNTDHEGVSMTPGYLNRALVHYSSYVSCGGSMVYTAAHQRFSDNPTGGPGSPSGVDPTPIAENTPVLQAATWSGNMGDTGKHSPYCVTRFVFTETSSTPRSSILEGGIFNIAVTQSR